MRNTTKKRYQTKKMTQEFSAKLEEAALLKREKFDKIGDEPLLRWTCEGYVYRISRPPFGPLRLWKRKNSGTAGWKPLGSVHDSIVYELIVKREEIAKLRKELAKIAVSVVEMAAVSSIK